MCNKPFMWFSGDNSQICSKCIDEKMGGGFFEVYQRFKNPEENGPVACYRFVGYNEAKTYEEAVQLLIKNGVPEDEIINDEKI